MTNCVKNSSALHRVKERIKILRLVLFGVMVTLFMGGCAAVRPPTPSLAPVSSDELLQAVKVQGERFHSLQGTAVLTVARAGREQNIKQVLLVQRPNQLRAEVLGLFGQPVMTVAAAGDRLSAYIPGEKKFYTGPASSTNLYRLVRVPMELPDLVRFVFYDVPLLPFSSGAVQVGEGYYRLHRHAADGRQQELSFDNRLRLRRVRYVTGEDEVLRVRFDDIRDEDGLPRQVRLALPAADTQIDLEWREVLADGDIPESRFHLQPPAGTEVEALP